MFKIKKSASTPFAHTSKIVVRQTFLFVLALLPCAFMASRAEAYSFVLTTTANPVQIGEEVELTATLTDEDDPSDLPITVMNFFDGAGSDTPTGVPLCLDVPVTVVDPATIVARCVRFFISPGLHDVVAEADGGGLPGQAVSVTNDVPETVTDIERFDPAQTAMSGTWYNPATSGQGLEISVLHVPGPFSGSWAIFGGWFTFDDEANPDWYTLSGTQSGDPASYIIDLATTSDGGVFDAPPQVDGRVIGSAFLTFYDCTHATLRYAFTAGPGYRSGVIPLVRLTAATGCSAEVPAVPPDPPPAHLNDALHSGVWYDPATSGQGLVIDIAPAQSTFFATWYAYAPASESLIGPAARRWFAMQTSYTPGNLDFENVPIYTTTGGLFNQPSTVARQVVGSADMTFTSCSTMTLDYTFTEGEFAGLSGSIDEINPEPPAGCE